MTYQIAQQVKSADAENCAADLNVILSLSAGKAVRLTRIKQFATVWGKRRFSNDDARRPVIISSYKQIMTGFPINRRTQRS